MRYFVILFLFSYAVPGFSQKTENSYADKYPLAKIIIQNLRNGTPIRGFRLHN